MDQAKKRSNLNTEKIAEIISIPNSEIFFEKKTKDELQISCKYDWLVNNITEKVKLRNKENKDFKTIIKKNIDSHLHYYWSEDDVAVRDLKSRTIGEWISNEISFLAGFALWFREKEEDKNIDLSNLISKAVGEEVAASGEVEFDKERFKILNDLTSNTLSILRDMSPAGKIAYRSMDIAIIKGLSDGDGMYASKMKERTLPNQNPWWKFW
tara:strand:+ start:3520 stop:4152 length:633 start_codon:yes stop_codon:yes gene_type:complete